MTNNIKPREHGTLTIGKSKLVGMFDFPTIQRENLVGMLTGERRVHSTEGTIPFLLDGGPAIEFPWSSAYNVGEWEPDEEVEVEWRLTGFPGCNDYHPESESEARGMLGRAKAQLRDARSRYIADNNPNMVEEMNRRIANAGIESRTTTDWKGVE